MADILEKLTTDLRRREVTRDVDGTSFSPIDFAASKAPDHDHVVDIDHDRLAKPVFTYLPINFDILAQCQALERRMFQRFVPYLSLIGNTAGLDGPCCHCWF